MTVISALVDRYNRLAQDGLAPRPGYGPAKISFSLVLNAGGRVVGVDDLRTRTGKNLRPKIVQSAPMAPNRSTNIAATAFWDKTSYVLGATAKKSGGRLEREHAAFKALHEELLSNTKDAGCLALLRFLYSWNPEKYHSLDYAAEMADLNVAFRLEGDLGFIHDRPAAIAAFSGRGGDGGATPERMCLVSGDVRPIARLHPPIKGVMGAQSSGARIVSSNQEAFNSYGKTQGENSPISEEAAFAYTSALNALLAPSGADAKGRPQYRNQVVLGSEVTVAFWAETPVAEAVIADLLAPPKPDEATETAEVRKVLRAMEEGRPLPDAVPEVDPSTRVYVLGLSPSTSRISVRFWLDQSLGDLSANFSEHWSDLRIEPAPNVWPPTTYWLLRSLAPQFDSKKVPDHMAGELTRSILTGLPYPRSLLMQSLMRIRADGGITPLRVALIKAVLTRAERKRTPHAKDTLMSLDRDEKNVGYRLGRLFALLGYAQFLSVGPANATVEDKFFASASATPARAFPTILRMARHHISDARKKDKTARKAGWAEEEIKQAISGLPASSPFPSTLSHDDQGRFIVGYYHQKVTRSSDKPDDQQDDQEATNTTGQDG